jgi:hypothetical protein
MSIPGDLLVTAHRTFKTRRAAAEYTKLHDCLAVHGRVVHCDDVGVFGPSGNYYVIEASLPFIIEANTKIMKRVRAA